MSFYQQEFLIPFILITCYLFKEPYTPLFGDWWLFVGSCLVALLFGCLFILLFICLTVPSAIPFAWLFV